MEESRPHENTADSHSVYAYVPEIEIISLDDERLKILGEEISSDTGRAILSCIFQGKTTAGEIARTLNLSLPLVIYHIERLMKTTIIKIAGVELNSKGRERKVYGAKAAIVIHLNPNDANLKRRLRRLFILSASVTAIGVVSAIWQAVNLQNQVQFVISDPEDFVTPLRPLIPVILSGIGGAASAALAWAIGWLKRHR
jgi:DNA-binding Lrp family transcriptional regulator